MFKRTLKSLVLLGFLMGSLALAEPKPEKPAVPAVATEDVASTGESTAPYNDPALPVEQVALAEGVPEVDVKSYLLVDFQSGEELAGLNPGIKVEPASITKLMTAYIIYQELGKGTFKLEDPVLVSEKAWKMEGSRMFVENGSKVEFGKLLKGMIIQSGNDATVALAEHIAGSEDAFVKRMNETAAALGMKDTHYMNVTGWPVKDHYTTARDIVTLVKALINEFPEHYKLYAEKEFSYNNIKQQNRNKLLWRDSSVDGLKTGHTESAGFCLVASAKRDNMRLVSVVLGAKSEDDRADASQKLLEYGFRTFETHKLFDAGAVLTHIRVWKGEEQQVPVGVMSDLMISTVKGSYDKLDAKMQLNRGVDAPVKRGDVLGKIIITEKDSGKLIKETPLFALDDVEEGGWWRGFIDGVQKLFTN